MKTFTNPFIIDPIVMIYGSVFLFFWYDSIKNKHPDIEFRIVDVIIVMFVYLFLMFVGIYK